MKNFINQVSIQNFKSIKNLEFEAKRINLFIGEPNTGKTNILEALSLFSIPFIRNSDIGLKEFIRMNNIYHLFYEQDIENEIKVGLKRGAEWIYSKGKVTESLELKYIGLKPKSRALSASAKDNSVKLNVTINGKIINIINSNAEIIRRSGTIKPFYFQNEIINETYSDTNELYPPYGKNLTDVILRNKNLREIISPIFEEYGFELLIRRAEKDIELQKRKDGIVISYPYTAISDSLQRIVFYNAIITSNTNSVILLNEPLTHVFPFYSSDFAEKIVENTNNQYFITTHNPYIIQMLIEKTPIKDLNILVTYFEDDQTKVKIATEKQLSELMDFGMYILSNLETILEDE